MTRPFYIANNKGETPTWMFDWGDAYGYSHYWGHITAIAMLILFGICLTLILIYSFIQLYLTIKYKQSKKNTYQNEPELDLSKAPFVTVQLPMYNEYYVAERIIDCIVAIDYPKDKLEIQVLDDSTDETKTLVSEKVKTIKKESNIDIKHIHRSKRTGYKAGALQEGLHTAKGEFIAIFDVDFLPEIDFLQKTIPYFKDKNIGLVQTRWGHVNKSYSLLTELQAFGLNAHFTIEQTGRNTAGHFMNFNGTGGVWRKKCIEDAGGWEHDTLTEDLDLSYRAQLIGWKFKYLENIVAPAELPITMSALKSQQHRWIKGGAECLRKTAYKILTNKSLRLSDRIHGLAHLFNSSVFIFILILGLLSVPLLHIKESFGDLNVYIQYGAIFILSTLFLMYYYWVSFQDKSTNKIKSAFRFLCRFFQFLSVSIGLSLNNAIAALQGYLGIKSSFVRTPKFNVLSKENTKQNKYDNHKLSLLTITEGILFFLFVYSSITCFIFLDIGLLPFHLILAFGFGYVFFKSISEIVPGKIKKPVIYRTSKV